MTSRILPPYEWHRLDGTELGSVWRALSREHVRVIVVEDEKGTIVGCWSVMPMYHAEGLWIAPEHRQRSVVLRRLWGELMKTAEEFSLHAILTSSVTPVVTAMLERRGATPMPGTMYVLPLERETPTESDKALGERFHEQLFALMPSAVHADDADHHGAVGRAMRVGVFEGEPEKAQRQYNAWALPHGYAPVRFLEKREDGSVVVDIVEAVIAVTPDGTVSVMENRLEPTPCPQ